MKVLFGVFDWGIGHATRDIPLIEELLKENEVHIISTGRALKVLKNHLADRCEYYDVPSVYSPYTRTRFFQLKFSLSISKLFKSLKHARESSEKIISRGFDKVISDCRYDVYDNAENSYLINHQLRFMTPFGVQRVFEMWLASRMKKYKYVIVPDFDRNNLSGRLSHNLRYIRPDKIKYIGILSHLRKVDIKEDIDYFISLSGPEPQRSILEEKILLKIDQLEGRIVIAGGNPDAQLSSSSGNIESHSFLNAQQQENVMNRAKFIIARSGYTTIMELAELNKKKALFLPTPGQTEQEYLANYCEKHNYFHHVSQYHFHSKIHIQKAGQCRGFEPAWKTQESVRRFMDVINA
jgi:uncharacterized protein (TIGR00661 family)